MPKKTESRTQLIAEIDELRARLAEAEEALRVARSSAVDTRAVSGERAVTDNGMPQGGIVFLDQTAERSAQEALRESAANLRRAQEIAHIGSWTYDLTSRITWSDEMYCIYGVSPAAFTRDAEAFISLIHSDDRAAMQAWIDACTAGQKPGELVFRAVHPDGTLHYINGRGELICDAEGRPSHMVGTAQDITERKRAEAALAAERALLRARVLKMNVQD